ncbi:aldolase/citrate lyase family protein [Blastococcus sp. LR1]|uniref:DUF6986 family protein n=1 Tax=Blastococcus sp. LR1 TaxID=2877000 RepID=UPI001CCC3171|nr:aldolase/citrate lyase family protein [Blastococcus sp. LR1]MCA0145360.1 aldolase [Blastococcus sp. LR1]
MRTDALLASLDTALAADDAARTARYPGPAIGRQPVHTVYVPADRITADTPQVWGAAAVAVLDEHGPLAEFAPLEERIRAKLATEPIEDLRVDAEDGYGVRSDDDEDRDVRAAAQAVGAMLSGPAAPPFVGLRLKSLEAATRRRGLRSAELFLDTLLAAGPLPPGFRFTLPKVTSVAQVEAMAAVCEALEQGFGVSGLRFEIQVETPQAVLGADGRALVAPMITAASGRCAGLHYGTYDYSAALGVAASEQSLEHPVADHAKAVMQVAAAGTGVPVCDGSTNVLPVGDAAAVEAARRLHADLVTRSLRRGFYQGWDLHPGQLPTRYAATFRFFRDGMQVAADRLVRWLDRADSGVLDEPATARALAGYLVRGLDSGALDAAEVVAAGGPDRATLDRLLTAT